ncbi:hypothetical protein [Agromyces italicus]|uniref:hypothetical protein n=1 Tax=Agromyces italicus TaxID=279572 RepID=UPI0003B56542|nr:hypothetical protein [Agromyces italicus]
MDLFLWLIGFGVVIAGVAVALTLRNHSVRASIDEDAASGPSASELLDAARRVDVMSESRAASRHPRPKNRPVDAAFRMRAVRARNPFVGSG